MHEASLVKSLLKQLSELVAQHGGGHIREIRVEIGLLAGIEPLLFHEAFQRERSGTLAADAELVIAPVGLTCHCQGCQLILSETRWSSAVRHVVLSRSKSLAEIP